MSWTKYQRCVIRLVHGAVWMVALLAVVFTVAPADAQEVANLPGVTAPDAFGGHASTHVIIRTKPGFAPIQLVNKSWTLQPDAQRDATRIKNDLLAATAARYRVASIEPAFTHQPANRHLLNTMA